MANSFNLPSLQGPHFIHKSNFLGHTNFIHKSSSSSSSSSFPKQSSHQIISPCAKFDLFEILGGRGLLGEEGIEKELKKPPPETSSPPPPPPETSSPPSSTTNDEEDVATLPENGFEKELQGLTGGFPGGEIGLQDFLEKHPPPEKPSPPSSTTTTTTAGFDQKMVGKPKAPELPLLMPGMIAIVTNPNSPYHMYCGIVQRITDGKAGVLFEGGNWDRLITFKLNELERREKGPPMVSPRSVMLEELLKEGS